MNVWDEKDKEIGNSANLNAMIINLTSSKNHGTTVIPRFPLPINERVFLSADARFMKMFLATYHSFTTPAVLLKKLLQRYTTPPKTSDRKVC